MMLLLSHMVLESVNLISLQFRPLSPESVNTNIVIGYILQCINLVNKYNDLIYGFIGQLIYSYM